MAPTVLHSGAPKRPSLRSRSWTIAAIRRQRRSGDAEDRAQRFEGASVTLVAELHPEHVERHAVIRNGLPIGGEAESGLTIDEETYQPGRRHAIDARARPRDPQAPLKRRRPSGVIPWSGRRRPSSGAADSVLELAKHGEHTIAAGTAEEIDLLGRDETFPKDVDEATERRCSCALGSPRARRTLQRLFDVPAQFLVQVLPCPPELLDERIVGPGIDVVGREHARIASGGLHLGLQPLEILARVGRIGKRIHRLFQWNRADLLEAAPGRDSEVGGVRRELVDEQQPATTVVAPPSRLATDQREPAESSFGFTTILML